MSARASIAHVLQALLVAGMVACVAFSVVDLVQANIESWNGSYLGLFCSLVAVEAFLSTWLYYRLSLHIYGGTKFRLTECAVLLALLQVATDINSGHPLLSEGVPRFDPQTLGLFVPVLLCWEAARGTAGDLREVTNPAVRLPNSGSPVDRLARRFFVGGFILFIAVGLMQAQNAQLLRLTGVTGSGPVVNVMLYFLLGMAMLGQVHYGSLQGRWKQQGAVLPSALTARWVRYSAIFLGSVAIVTFLLPTGYAGVLLDAARDQSGALLAAIGEHLANLLASLGISPHRTAVPPPTLRQPLPPHLTRPHGAAAHPQSSAHFDFRLLRAIAFWLVTAAVTVYLLRGYLEQQRIHIRLPKQMGLVWSVLQRIVRALAGLFGRTRRMASRLIPSVRRPAGKSAGLTQSAGDNRFRRGRSPRERIVYYFLSVLERADRQGIQRRRSETPGELESRIALRVPEAREDMAALTQAYLEARYSDHPLDREASSAARGPWERVRAALRALRPGA